MEVPKGKERQFVEETPDIEDIPEEKLNFFRWVWSNLKPPPNAITANKSHLNVELIVKGIPVGTELHEVESHFNRQCNGGCGDVKLISWVSPESASDTLTARVTFGAESTVRSVMWFQQYMVKSKWQFFPVGLKKLLARKDPMPTASQLEEMAYWRAKVPVDQLPKDLSNEDVEYLLAGRVLDGVEFIFAPKGEKDPDHHADLKFKPKGEGEDSDQDILAVDRPEIDLISHMARIAYKMSHLIGHIAKMAEELLQPTEKSAKRKRNADATDVQLELDRLQKIFETDMVGTFKSSVAHLQEILQTSAIGPLNSTISHLHQTAKRLTKDLVDLKKESDAQQEKEEISQAKIAQLNLAIENLQKTVTRGSQDLTESERIRAELNRKFVSQQINWESSEAELTQLKQDWTKSQSERKLAQEGVKTQQVEIATLNSTVTSLKQTANRLKLELAESKRIGMELRNQTVAQHKVLESQDAVAIHLSKILNESLSDCRLAHEKENLSQEEIVQLNISIENLQETVTRGTQDLSKSNQIRAELNAEIATQKDLMDFFRLEVGRLNQDWSESQSELLSSQKSLSAAQEEIGKLNDANSQLQEKLKSSHDRVVKMADLNEKISAVTTEAFGRKAEIDQLCDEAKVILGNLDENELEDSRSDHKWI